MRAVVAEFLATSLLLAVVTGSGIMGERLAGGNVAVALLANSLATGAGLVALILVFGPVSGAHMNPVVTFAEARLGALTWRTAALRAAAQIAGAFAGVALAHLMFELPVFGSSPTVRDGFGRVLGEFTATYCLLLVVLGCSRTRPSVTPFAVGAVVTAGYWFTSSTSFANPAVTLARTATDTFVGIRTADAPAFLLAQGLGAIAAVATFRRVLHPAGNESMQTVIFACVHNAGRSQMAAAFFRSLADATKARAISAGTQPAARVHPEVLAAMHEVGIDLSDAKPTLLSAELARGATLLVTMGCGETCPVVPGLRREDWPLQDPKGQSMDHVRAIRDEVRQRVAGLVRRLGVAAVR